MSAQSDAAARQVFVPDQEKAALSGVSAEAIATALEVVINGRIATYVHAPAEAAPLPIRLQVPYAQRTDIGNLHIKGLPGIAKIRGAGGVTDAPTPLVSLAELGHFSETTRDQPIYHKDLEARGVRVRRSGRPHAGGSDLRCRRRSRHSYSRREALRRAHSLRRAAAMRGRCRPA